MSKSGLWRTLVLLVGLSLFATVQAHAQNGLQRFEKDIKPQLEFKSFTYDKAAPLGDKGFTLSNVVAVVPASATGGKDSTIKIEKVTVEEADFDRMKDTGKKDEVPLFAKIKIEGMTGDDELSGMLESFGIPKAPVDLALDYRLNPADKVLTVSKLEVGLQGQGSLSLSLVLDGVSDKASEAAGAKDTASLRSASLVYTDVGLLSQLVPAVAKQQGMAADAMIAMAVAPIGAFAVGKGPGTVKALDGLASFITDWKKPKGPITISVAPAKSASLADLDKLEQPNALTDIFGLKVEYAGTRAGAAGGGSGRCRCPAGGRQDDDGCRGLADADRQHGDRQGRWRGDLRVLPQGRHAGPAGRQRDHQGQVVARGRAGLLQVSRRGQGLPDDQPHRRRGHLQAQGQERL